MNYKEQHSATLVTFLAVLGVFGTLAAVMVQPYLAALTMGAILSSIMHPVYRRLVAKGIRPGVASGIITIGAVILLVGPALTFMTLALKQAAAIGSGVGMLKGLSLSEMVRRAITLMPFLEVVGDLGNLDSMFLDAAQSLASTVTQVVLGLAASIPTVSIQVVLAVITSFFLNIDGRRAAHWMASRLPLDAAILNQLRQTFRDTALSAVSATMGAAAAQALIMLIGFAALRVPAAFLAAGSTFVLAFVPLVGSTPVWITGALYLYFQGSLVKCAIMLGVGGFTTVIDNIVRPMILKGQGAMHPLVSLVAIFGGIGTFGVMGVFLGPITAAIVITLLQVWPIIGRRAGLPMLGSEREPSQNSKD